MIKRKKAPYSDTAVEPGKTKAEIEKLLRDYGVDGVSWTEIWSQNKAQLQFVLESEGKRPIMVRLEPPSFSMKRRSWSAEKGRHIEIDAPNWAQSYRLLKAYLKAKLESVAYGLRDLEEEFLSDMVVRDSQGRETTVGEIAERMFEAGEMRPMLGPGQEPPPARIARNEAVDAEYRSDP